MNPFSNTYNSDASDRELFKRIKEGDKNSLNTLISRHQPFIYNIAWKMTGDSVTAEDLSQEALLKIISNLGSFKHKSSFRTWAYRIVRNHFLNDTKKVLKRVVIEDFQCNENTETPEDIFKIWVDLKSEKEFREKYYYIEWDKFSFLNDNEMFLQILSMYNLASPVMALLVPVFMSISPFIVIKMRGIDITLSNYYTVFKDVAKNHAIGKLFTSFNEVDWQQRITILMSAGIYIMSLYQNIVPSGGPNLFALTTKDITIRGCNMTKDLVYGSEEWKQQFNWTDEFHQFINDHIDELQCVNTVYEGIESMPQQFVDHFTPKTPRSGKSLCRI